MTDKPKQIGDVMSATIERLKNPSPEERARLDARGQRLAQDNQRRAAEEQRQAKAACWRASRKSLADHGKRYSAESASMQTYDCRTPAQSKAKGTLQAYLKDSKQRIADGCSIVLFGPPGTGKDHLMAACLWSLAECGEYMVRWLNCSDLFEQLRDSFDSRKPEREVFAPYLQCDVLGISDIVPTRGDLTPFQSDALYRLIDSRYSDNKPTFVTLNAESGKDAESAVGVRTIDRLRHGGIAIHCNWPSHRKGATQ